jgi:hypothetical protein
MVYQKFFTKFLIIEIDFAGRMVIFEINLLIISINYIKKDDYEI